MDKLKGKKSSARSNIVEAVGGMHLHHSSGRSGVNEKGSPLLILGKRPNQAGAVVVEALAAVGHIVHNHLD